MTNESFLQDATLAAAHCSVGVLPPRPQLRALALGDGDRLKRLLPERSGCGAAPVRCDADTFAQTRSGRGRHVVGTAATTDASRASRVRTRSSRRLLRDASVPAPAAPSTRTARRRRG